MSGNGCRHDRRMVLGYRQKNGKVYVKLVCLACGHEWEEEDT